ncbi:MAG: C40 family peptidase [Candidatus Eisenbacteria sp.]|nr:C40 family peptidase [Candidatus Eisenbacteria bacterium]
MKPWSDYIGIPYAENGRDESGVDCWGLVRMAYLDRYRVSLPSYTYGLTPELQAKEIEARQAEGWRKVDDPQEADVVLLRQLRQPCHVGVVCGDGNFLHCEEGIGVVSQCLRGPRWKNRIEGFFRYITLETVRVVVQPKPLSEERSTFTFDSGITLQDVVEQTVIEKWRKYAHVDVQGIPVSREAWLARVKGGGLVTIKVVPQSGRNLLRTILTIAVMAWAGGAGGRLFGRLLHVSSAVGGAVAGSLGLMAINALVPPPQPTFRDLSGLDRPNAYSITGTQNQVNRYGVIAVVLGTHKIYPSYGSLPYTSVQGSDQYLHCLFVLGYGELHFVWADAKIGDNVLSSFPGHAEQGVYGTAGSHEITKYATDSVTEEALAIDLKKNIPQVRTTASDTDSATVDILLPGLAAFNADGSLNTRRAHLTVEFRETGTSGAWSNPIGRFVKGLTLTNGGSGYTPGRYDLVFTGAGGSGASGTADVTIDTSGSNPKLPQDAPEQTTVAINLDPGKIQVSPPPPSIGASAVSLGGYGNGYTGAVTVALPAAAGGGAGFACTVSLQDGHILEGASLKPIRHSFELDFPSRSQWDVRVTRTSDEGDGQREIDAMQWTAIRSIKEGASINFEPPYLAKIALKLKATGQLNGVVDTFNILVQSKCKKWNRATSAWDADQITSNPADLYRYVAQHPANLDAALDGDIDLDGLATWSEFCDDKGFTFSAVFDTGTTVDEVLTHIAAAGRAARAPKDGKLSVIIDDVRATPVQLFTPKNSKNFQGQIVFVELPHAYRCRFVNEDEDYTQTERIVYADGYSSSNATVFEALDFFGVTDSDHVWKLARYHLAVAQYRREIFTLETNWEHLVCQCGDRVDVQHDSALIGVAAGRVKAVVSTILTVDEVCTMELGETYVVRVRKADGTISEWDIVTVEGDNLVLMRSGGVPFDCAVGDLFAFGVTDESVQSCLVKNVEPLSELGARLTLVPYAPEVYDADSGAIPPYTVTVTIPPELLPPNPPRVFEGGDYLYREGANVKQGVSLRWVHPENTIASKYEIQIQLPGGSEHEPACMTTRDTVDIPDLDAGTYDFRIRTLRGIQASEWVEVAVYIDAMTEAPKDVTGLRSSYKGNACLLAWVPVEDVRKVVYEVRHQLTLSTWDAATLVAVTEASEHWPQIKGWYWIKARCNGVYSANRALTYVAFATIDVSNAKKTVSETFGGTFSGRAYPRLPLPFTWDSNWRGYKTAWTAGAWDDEYDPSTEGLPTADGWTGYGTGDEEIDGDGKVHISGTALRYYRKANGSTSSLEFVTIEAAVRVDEGDVAFILARSGGTSASGWVYVEHDHITIVADKNIPLDSLIVAGDFCSKERRIRVELRYDTWVYVDDELMGIVRSHLDGGIAFCYFGRLLAVQSDVSQQWGEVKFAVDVATADNNPAVGDGWTAHGPVYMAPAVPANSDYWMLSSNGGATAGYRRTPAMASGDCLHLQLVFIAMPAGAGNGLAVILANGASGYGVYALAEDDKISVYDASASEPGVLQQTIDIDTTQLGHTHLLSVILYGSTYWVLYDRTLLFKGTAFSGMGPTFGNYVRYTTTNNYSVSGGLGLCASPFQHDTSPAKGISVMPGDGGEYTIDSTDQVDLGYSAETAVTSEMTTLGIARKAAAGAIIWRDFDLLESPDLLLEVDLLTGGPEHAQSHSAEAQISIHDGTAFDDFTRLVPGLYYGEQFNLRAVLQATKSDPLHIPSWDWEIDMPDIRETQAVTSLAGGDLTVTWVKSFQAAPQVVASIISEQAGDHIVISGVSTTICLISVYNAAARVVRTIHVVANGY